MLLIYAFVSGTLKYVMYVRVCVCMDLCVCVHLSVCVASMDPPLFSF